MIDTDKYSGMIGDKEVEMHRLDESVWAIDVVRHTSEDTKELVEGLEVADEWKAHQLYNQKVNELRQFDYPERFEYPEDTWCDVTLDGPIYDCHFWTEDDGQRYVTFYRCFMDKHEQGDYINTNTTSDYVTFKLIPEGELQELVE